jgi:hypothetical protein
MKRTLTTSLMLVLGLPALALGSGQLASSTRATTVGAAARTRLAAHVDSPASDGRDLDNVFTAYELLDLDLQSVTKQGEAPRRLSLRLGGITRELALVPHDLRAPSYRSVVTTDEGVFEEPAGPVTTYRGTVVGEPGSDVRLLIQDTMVVGYIRTPADWLFIEPASRYERGMPSGRTVVYREADVRVEHRGECGARGLARHVDALAGGTALERAPAKTAASDGLRIVEIATDADFEFFRANGTSTNAVIEGIINQVDGIYQSELGIAFTITRQHVWATADDPYTTTSPKKLLRQFKREWNRTGGTGAGVGRDVAHLFTGRDLVGAAVGQASTAVVCSDPANSYGLSQASATATLVKIVAHQLGHNFGVASHDDERTPAADDCDGDGPLMCAGVQGAGANVFSQESRDDILAHVEAHGSCLDTGITSSRRVRGDYDGDGKADLSIKVDDGFWLIDFATNGFGTWDVEFFPYGDSTAHAVPADYDGDGKTDLSVKTDNGEWFIDFAAGGFGPGTDLVSFSGYGSTNGHPVPADYDGDGKADLSVKTDEGVWFIDYASNGFGAWNVVLEGYGFSNAHPVPADYDGDGKADLSVKADDGFWLIDFAANGFGTWDVEFSSYGDTTAHPVPADYDGDGKADLSVKTDSGEWLIDWAAGGFGPGTDLVVLSGYGFSNAHPIPLDYDGDGKTDLSAKTDEGFWFIDYKSNGFGAWDVVLEGYGSVPPAVPGN